jgi:hypothetical protein
MTMKVALLFSQRNRFSNSSDSCLGELSPKTSVITRLGATTRCQLATTLLQLGATKMFRLAATTMIQLAATTLLLLASSVGIAAQTQKLPSPEKIVEAHLKAIGGKKNVAAIRSATYDWVVHSKDYTDGSARWQIKAPGSVRLETTFGNKLETVPGNKVEATADNNLETTLDNKISTSPESKTIITAANTSSAWTAAGGVMRTLTGAEAAVAKLRAFLDAGRLVEFKKANVLARVVSAGDLASEPSYIVEFSRRNGAKLTYWFSIKTKLLVKVIDDSSRTTIRFSDYRSRGNILEPHRIHISRPGLDQTLDQTLELQNVSYNSLIADAVFDPPAADTAVDVTSLLRAVGRNQDEVEERVNEYSFMQKETEREINGRGEIKKETVKVYEVFPIANRDAIMKLISENGVALTGERAAKEEKRVTEEFMKADRDREKDQQKADRRKEERKKKAVKGEENEDPGISQFLTVCEFVSPRHERFRDRDAVVFDFRPRPGFKPTNRSESLISKLVGVVWIDPADKQVMRLEARLAEGFKMGGGLLVSVKPGAAMVMEQTRMIEGVWLPSFAQINLSVKVLLFGGGDINETVEWSDYRHFAGKVHDYKLEYPRAENQPEKKP